MVKPWHDGKRGSRSAKRAERAASVAVAEEALGFQERHVEEIGEEHQAERLRLAAQAFEIGGHRGKIRGLLDAMAPPEAEPRHSCALRLGAPLAQQPQPRHRLGERVAFAEGGAGVRPPAIVAAGEAAQKIAAGVDELPIIVPLSASRLTCVRN